MKLKQFTAGALTAMLTLTGLPVKSPQPQILMFDENWIKKSWRTEGKSEG